MYVISRRVIRHKRHERHLQLYLAQILVVTVMIKGVILSSIFSSKKKNSTKSPQKKLIK